MSTNTNFEKPFSECDMLTVKSLWVTINLPMSRAYHITLIKRCWIFNTGSESLLGRGDAPLCFDRGWSQLWLRMSSGPPSAPATKKRKNIRLSSFRAEHFQNTWLKLVDQLGFTGVIVKNSLDCRFPAVDKGNKALLRHKITKRNSLKDGTTPDNLFLQAEIHIFTFTLSLKVLQLVSFGARLLP